jgi:hypothetical protein
MKNLPLLVLVLIFPALAVAQEKPDSPRPKESSSLKAEHPYANRNFWIGSAAMGASSLGPWIGGNICRHNNGVEPCTEHYGSYNAWNGLLTGASVFAAPAVFYGCRKEYQKSKWCWLIPGIVVGGNVGWGIHEARINHPDLTPDAIVRRK